MPTHFLLFRPTRVKAVARRCHGRSRVLQAKCFYYFFMAVVVITDEAKATARRALTFLVRIFGGLIDLRPPSP
jgi:hypothetical protein